MKMSRLLTACTLSLGLMTTFLSAPAMAEDPAGETVTIRNDGANTYYEFRVNGEVVEIKVQPDKGPAYYLVPASDNPDEFQRKDVPDMRVPKWVIFRW